RYRIEHLFTPTGAGCATPPPAASAVPTAAVRESLLSSVGHSRRTALPRRFARPSTGGLTPVSSGRMEQVEVCRTARPLASRPINGRGGGGGYRGGRGRAHASPR